MSARGNHQCKVNFRSADSIIISMVVALSGCLEPYAPPTPTEDVDMLVIDGFLNSGDGSASVRLTRASELSSQEETQTVSSADVYVRTKSGKEYKLPEQEPGRYSVQGLVLDPSENYQLSVRTIDNQEIQSDYVQIRPTPAIDSIVWRADEEGVDIYVNAHDASGNTRYYRWDFTETWEYDATVSSDFKLVNHVPVYRSNEERIHTCWKTVPSTSISIASTIRLAEDVVYNYPLVHLPKHSQKMQIMYSILVRQRAISKDEYTFLEQLEKTTESLGGLFDPQPSQVPGNMHNLTDPGSPVLGYFSAGDATEKRFFLSFLQLPDDLQRYPRPVGCQVDTICGSCVRDLGETAIIGSEAYKNFVFVGYTVTNFECADCRSKGGVLEKPTFWP